MRLLDYLRQVLISQGQTLEQLALLISEEELIQTLASEEALEPTWIGQIQPEWLIPSPSPFSDLGTAFEDLDSAVQSLGLPDFLEPYVWNFPFYRSIVEDSWDLGSLLQDQTEVTEKLIQQAVLSADAWIESRFHPSPTEKPILQAPWVRFRAEILRMSGSLPIRPL